MEQFCLYRELPKAVRDILAISEGWLVGGSIKSLLAGEVPNDYDIIIKDVNYIPTYSYVSDKLTGFNSFGGLRVEVDNIKIDVWIEELDHFIIKANRFSYAYNFRKNLLLTGL